MIYILGKVIKEISRKSHWGVEVNADQCYACSFTSPLIDVYACNDWRLLRSIHLPCSKSYSCRHTITVSSQHIKVCCWNTSRLIILNLDGKLESIHGPEIDVIGHSHEAANRVVSVKSLLMCPYLYQEDNEGNVLIADCSNNRLLLFTAEGNWHDVTPDCGLMRPRGASWLNGRLYVGKLWNKSITMFE